MITPVTHPAHSETPAPSPAAWIGVFNDEDRAGIEALRAGQADAIERSDAEAYSRLCTDDILLVFPGRDVIEGRAAFIACERELFRAPRAFNAVRKCPLRVERSGDLAVEIGRHELCAVSEPPAIERVLARRKYLHVMRHTSVGWRFAVLTSSATD
ncbi:MAG TPA: nuclear transport factor 2 family protein [Candidatus Synoicihabitans sp.]|nr:nuclear transport factor 2 family protein [Candidatus Synoicihabitans sp.]